MNSYKKKKTAILQSYKQKEPAILQKKFPLQKSEKKSKKKFDPQNAFKMGLRWFWSEKKKFFFPENDIFLDFWDVIF